ncbi:MAG: ACP S-malonyltransferase [Myxococcales bacterium FL481]|nr:MAG: ACP S-malonyltransferase [Myxococcales bacterium FL481]
MNQSAKQTAIVVCPGRGTYASKELGYFRRYHAAQAEFLARLDAYRQQRSLPSISELDGAAAFSSRLHTTSENASPLIYACAVADFLAIDRSRYDIVGITGNSMGWYLALACGEAVDHDAGMHLVSTMGSLMQREGEGGQVLFPLVDENWVYSAALKAALDRAVEQVESEAEIEVYASIHLGGIAVLAATQAGISALMNALPPVQDRYPMVLVNHAAFHTPLMNDVSDHAKQLLSGLQLSAPAVPLIDGRGKIWAPYATDPHDLYAYTLEEQVFDTYDYSAAIACSVKEFAPDRVIVLGPGATLGGPTAQELIKHRWCGWRNKADFVSTQANDPFILAMGIEDQRARVVASAG